jgi:hypothetical protein
MALVDFYEIQEGMLKNDYDSICQGDDSVCSESIENARAYLAAVAEKLGIDYDEEDSVIRLALKKRTMAEMYMYAAEWTTAEKYKRECSEILAPLAPVKKTSGAYYSGSSDWKGFR